MPNVQQTRLNKGALIALLFIMLTIGACFLPIPWWAKAVIAVVLVGVFLFIRRGYIYFYRAAVTLQKENTPKVWNLMKKALAAHVDDERKPRSLSSSPAKTAPRAMDFWTTAVGTTSRWASGTRPPTYSTSS